MLARLDKTPLDARAARFERCHQLVRQRSEVRHHENLLRPHYDPICTVHQGIGERLSDFVALPQQREGCTLVIGPSGAITTSGHSVPGCPFGLDGARLRPGLRGLAGIEREQLVDQRERVGVGLVGAAPDRLDHLEAGRLERWEWVKA